MHTVKWTSAWNAVTDSALSIAPWESATFSCVSIPVGYALRTCRTAPSPELTRLFLHVIDHLDVSGIAYTVTGGCAVSALTGNREIRDVDLLVSSKDLARLRISGENLKIDGPEQYEDEWFKGYTLSVYQMRDGIAIACIDILAADQIALRRGRSHEWTSIKVDIGDTQIVTVSGRPVPFLSSAQLIAAKKVLSRPQDLEDISALAANTD